MKSFAFILLLALSSASAYRVVVPEEVEPVAKVIEPLHAEESLSAEEVAYEEEGRALSAQEFDKQAFIDMLETLLWDADEAEEVHSEDGRQMRLYARKGLLRMTKPHALDDETSFAGRMYRNLQDTCYTGFCALGLGGLPTAFFDLFSALFK